MDLSVVRNVGQESNQCSDTETETNCQLVMGKVGSLPMLAEMSKES